MISDKNRLTQAKQHIGTVIENNTLESYPNGQLGVALSIIEKYEQVLIHRCPVNHEKLHANYCLRCGIELTDVNEE